MANLTDQTYFDSYPIKLPDGENSSRTELIDRYEPEILKKLLGYELWKLVAAYDAGTSPQRIKDLVEGKEYTVNHEGRVQTIKWNGLKNTEKESLITYYCYFFWQKNNASHTGNVGELTPKQQYSKIANGAEKAAHAWFLCRELYGFYGQDELEPSAFNFLTEFESEYPEWVFKKLGQVFANGI